MSWLNPSPGTSHRSHGPDWLQPSAGVSSRGSVSGRAQRSASSASEHLADWLKPGAGISSGGALRLASSAPEQPSDWLTPSGGSQASGRPPKKRSRTAEQQPHWLCPPVGHDASAPEISVQRSELPEEQDATANVRRIHLDLVSLLMINSKVDKPSAYQVNSGCLKDANAVV